MVDVERLEPCLCSNYPGRFLSLTSKVKEPLRLEGLLYLILNRDG